ncbi:MAG: Cna B-type domain-containing protein, partial [Acetatifactor sp.]
ITGTAATGYTVTNSHTPETVDIPFTKIWNDSSDAAGERPANIIVELLKNGAVADSRTLTGTGDSWSGSFTGLPKYEGGMLISYSVKEQTVPENYTMSISGTTITNTYAPGKTSVSVSKVWDDNSNQDGIRPASVTVKLYADGTYTGQYKTLNAGNSWAATFANLDKKSGGVDIVYTVVEDTVPDYTTNITGTAATGYTVTNSHTPEVRDIHVTKIWNDNGNSDGIRPSDVTIVLYADGVITGHTLTLNAGNAWNDSFIGLPKYNAGAEIVYTVGETAVSGYTVAFAGSAAAGFSVVNTHIPPTPPVPPTSDEPHSPKTGSPEEVVSWMTLFSGLAAAYLMLKGRRKREE